MLEIYTFRISLCFPKLACEITLVSFHIRITASQTNGSQACAEETSDGEAKCCQGSKKIINNVQTQQQRVAKLRNSKMVALFRSSYCNGLCGRVGCDSNKAYGIVSVDNDGNDTKGLSCDSCVMCACACVFKCSRDRSPTALQGSLSKQIPMRAHCALVNLRHQRNNTHGTTNARSVGRFIRK